MKDKIKIQIGWSASNSRLYFIGHYYTFSNHTLITEGEHIHYVFSVNEEDLLKYPIITTNKENAARLLADLKMAAATH